MMIQLFLLVLSGFAPDSGRVAVSADFSSGLAFWPAPGNRVTRGVAESYAGNWSAEFLDPELARRWEDLPSLAQVDLSARVDSLRIFARLPLRRDIDAWRRDPVGANWLLSVQELDINAPYEGWLAWHWSGISVQAGRFRQTYSPSPYGVILGSDLVHDGVAIRAPLGRWTFDWFYSSLNPWLLGTRADGSIEPGSEVQQQQTRTVSNERGRNYDAPEKALFFHRLSCQLGQWELAIAEQLLVGGVAPQWRQAVPFVVWHNNFGDGYSKVATGVQVVWSPAAGQFHLQGMFEDVEVPVGEVIGTDPRVVFGSNLGWAWQSRLAGGRLQASVDVTITSATFNNHRIPLLKGTSRRLYRSNNRSQTEPGFVDTWVVDQPLGYLRGSDAVDLWTHLDWSSGDSAWGTGLELDWLNQGNASVGEDADRFASRQGPLSGEVTTEVRALAKGWLKIRPKIRLEGRLGLVATRAHQFSVTPDLAASASIGF